MKAENLPKAILIGLIAGLSLLVLYFAIMVLSQSSFSSALSQLDALKLWVIPLILTLGIQAGLFVYVKECSKTTSGTATAVSTTTSSTAMIACCAHHITDILPLLGLSVFATFLSKYQIWFFAVGIASNLIGIGVILKQLKILRK